MWCVCVCQDGLWQECSSAPRVESQALRARGSSPGSRQLLVRSLGFSFSWSSSWFLGCEDHLRRCPHSPSASPERLLRSKRGWEVRGPVRGCRPSREGSGSSAVTCVVLGTKPRAWGMLSTPPLSCVSNPADLCMFFTSLTNSQNQHPAAFLFILTCSSELCCPW